jgi:outer membrane lipoprotein
MRSVCLLSTAISLCLLLSGCASQHAEDGSAASSITFLQVKAAPDSYRGQSVVFGGEVLSARRLKDGTRIEILQLPLDRSGHLGTDRMQSQGRFVAMHREFLDPATMPPGTRLTVNGEVVGSITLPLDETEYSYPVIEARHIEVLPPPEVAAQWRRPYAYPYMGSGYWGPYGSPYWRPWPYRW